MPSSGAVIHILRSGPASKPPAQGLGVAPDRTLLLAGFLRSVWPFRASRPADPRAGEQDVTEQGGAGTPPGA